MTQQLEKLVVTLEAKTASYEAKLKKASSDAQRWASTAKKASDHTAGSFNALGGKMGSFEKAIGRTSSAFKVQKNAVQGVSFQLQDMAVQAQAGTNAFTIMGQQGSQIASLFGPGGAVLGAIIAVSAGIGGTLARAMGAVNDEIVTLEKRVEQVIGRTYRAQLKEVNKLVEDQTDLVKRLQEEFERYNALVSKPIKPEGASYVYGTPDERQAIRDNIAASRIDARLKAMDKLAEAQAQLNLLLEKQSDIEAEMRKPETDAQDAIKKQKLKEAQERLQLEESVMGQVNKIRYEKYNPVQREQKIHEDRMALFRQYEELKLGTQSEYNALAEQETARHQDALREAQMAHYMENATAFENLMMQYQQIASDASKVIQDTLASSVDSFVNGFSYAMANAIVEGESLSEAFKEVGKSILKHALGSMIKLGVQMALNTIFAQKAQAALAGETIIMAGALAKAWATPAALSSLATVGGNAVPAQTGLVSTVGLANTLAVTGMAHDGIDNIPSEGTWLLDKGERVLSARQNADFTQFMQQFSSEGGDIYASHATKNINVQIGGMATSSELRQLLEMLNKEAGDKMNIRVINV